MKHILCTKIIFVVISIVAAYSALIYLLPGILFAQGKAEDVFKNVSLSQVSFLYKNLSVDYAESLPVSSSVDSDLKDIQQEVAVEGQDNQGFVVDDPSNVPFYSQFTDITSVNWKRVGCGIASLAMLIDYYKSNPPTVDTLLQEGINANAYLNDAGWTHAGLIKVSQKYGLSGQSHDLATSSMDGAFDSLQSALSDGPVMVSVHYKFESDNPIPHLVVANRVQDGMVYYNDPAANAGNLSLSVGAFKAAWKKRYIEIRPIS